MENNENIKNVNKKINDYEKSRKRKVWELRRQG